MKIEILHLELHGQNQIAQFLNSKLYCHKACTISAFYGNMKIWSVRRKNNGNY